MQSTGFDFLTLFSATKTQMDEQTMSGSSTQKSAIKNAFKLLFQQMLGKGVQDESLNIENSTETQNAKNNMKAVSGENSGSYLIHGQLVQMSAQKQKAQSSKNQTEIIVETDVTGVADNSKKTADTKKTKISVGNVMQSENAMEVNGSLIQGETGKQINPNSVGLIDTESKIVKKNQVTNSSAKGVGNQTPDLKTGQTNDSGKTEQKITQQINLSNKSEAAVEIGEKSEQSSKMKSQMIRSEAEIKQFGEKIQQGADKVSGIGIAEENTVKSSASAMKPEHMQVGVLADQTDSEMKKAAKKERPEGNNVTTVDDGKKNTDVDKIKMTAEASPRHESKSQTSENREKQFQNMTEKFGETKVQVQAASQKAASGNQAEATELQVKSEAKGEAIQFGSTTKAAADQVENLSQRPVQLVEQLSSVAEKASSGAVLREPIAEQVAPAMARMIRGNHSKMTLTLKPQELGSLKIELQSHQGVVGAKFLVESQEVRQLVEHSLPELKSMMERQGIQVESVEVEVRANSDGATSSQARFARNGNNSGQSGHTQQGGHRQEQQPDDSGQDWKRPSRQYGYNSVEYIA